VRPGRDLLQRPRPMKSWSNFTKPP
jgi:hypothetical protein